MLKLNNCILLDEEILIDLKEVVAKMKEEQIPIENWELTEIPLKSTYLFYNKVENKAFDYEKDKYGNLKPHYYKVLEGSKVNKHPVNTILEAISNYSI